MSSHTPEKLAYMANQIARNLTLDPDPVGAMAQHIHAYWTARMQDMILALADATGGKALDPVASEAISRLAQARRATASV